MSFHQSDFCRKINGCSVTSIVDLLSTQLGFTDDLKKILLERYEKMSQNFLNETYNIDDWHQDSESNFKNISPVPEQTDALYSIGGGVFQQNVQLNRLGGYYNVGMDLPVWFAKTKFNRKVMIIAQDPKRNNHESGRLILSTPWGVHSGAYATAPARAVKTFLQYLVDELNYCVYISDCTKLYFSEVRRTPPELPITQRREILNNIWPNAQKNILDSEINLFKPDVVITLGRDVIQNNPDWGIAGQDWREMVESLDGGWINSPALERPLLPLYHPSPLNGPGNRFVNRTFENIPNREERWKEYFQRKLNACLAGNAIR